MFAVIACLLIPGFELRAALRERPALALRPAALGPAPGEEPVLGPVTAAAEAAGIRPEMRMGEALALCPDLVLVEQDPATAEHEWEQLLQRLEDAGFGVEAAAVGCVYFETRGIERLYGGLEPALKRALAAVGPAWDARVGAAERRFAALAAATVARSGQVLIVSDRQTRDFLAPLPLTLLPVEQERREELEELGVKKLGQLAGLPGAAVAERLGPDGRRAWSLARGEKRGRVRARKVATELVETLEFPEAVANELTLRRALGALLDRLLARPERGDRAVRKLALSAKLVGGGSWRRTVTLRDATADRDRLRVALAPKLAELPAPIVKLGLEVVELAQSVGQQLELVRAEGAEVRAHLSEGLRQVRAGAGSGAVCSVVEVAPWSRMPEQRALLVPRDDC
jgi:nucleotidyltransferase/DNA polymerase involved in DNA repair